MIRRRAADAICLAALIAIALATGHLMLTTALDLPETLARAERMKGM